jgi:uncharacterized protein YjbJ (UPF0337 family)
MPDTRKDSFGEEASAFGQRSKGAVKDAVGSVTGNERLEREGELENAAGRQRQTSNTVLGNHDVRSDSEHRGTYAQSGYVTGLYNTPEEAGRAYQELSTRHNYKSDDIDVLMSDETRQRHFGDAEAGKEFETGTKAAEGLGKGSAIGGGLGAALGAIFAVGSSLVIPGIGLVVAGPIAGALAGLGAGGATGGLIGALVGAGIPEERAVAYERGLKEGGIVIGTRARDEQHAAELERDFTSYGGRDVYR